MSGICRIYWLVKPCLFRKLSLTVWQQQPRYSALIAAKIFCIENNTFEAKMLAGAILSVGYHKAEQSAGEALELLDHGSSLGHGSSQLFRYFQIFLFFIFFLDPGKSHGTLSPPCLLLSLQRRHWSSCSKACQAWCDISQLPQGWQSLGRADSTVQNSRGFELFSGSFKDHSTIPLHILQTLLKIFPLVVI